MKASPSLSRIKTKYFVTLILALCLAAMRVQAQPVFLNVMHTFTGDTGGQSNYRDGDHPGPIFIGSDNAIYGVTYGGGDTNLIGQLAGGTIFKINRDGAGYVVVHTFTHTESGISGPSDTIDATIGVSLIQGQDGFLYGTTHYGNNTYGYVFKCNTDGNDFSIIHDFSSADENPTSLIQGRDGLLYGTATGDIFTLDTQGGNYRVLHTFTQSDNSLFPVGSLLQAADGAFYGTCAGNWAGQDTGSVFKITTNGDFSVLHFFPGTNNDGYQPMAGLIQGSDGALYGTTFSGGSGYGTVFKINTDGTGYQVLHDFAGNTTDGAFPYSELVQAPPGLGNFLVGTTSGGTPADNGTSTIFKIGLDGSGYNVLYNFTESTNGVHPFAGLVAGPVNGTNGLFYGTTTYGGSSTNAGTLFSAVLPNPPLTITPITSQTAGGQTLISWPSWGYNYVLQSTTNLASTNWVTVSNAVPVSAVQVPSRAPSAYFRLIYQ